MTRSLRDAIEHRRTYYAITSESPIGDNEIKEIVEFAVRNVPSAFNSQSTRVVVLFGQHHLKLWNIALNCLKKIVPEETFESTQSRINSFAAGHGTLLFFEDQKVVRALQKQFPLYTDNFPVWAQQTSAMHQFAIWTMLEDTGLGVSIQHYNPLIDNLVRAEWNFPEDWLLIAQMPFGTPIVEPGEKTFQPIDKRVLVFK